MGRASQPPCLYWPPDESPGRDPVRCPRFAAIAAVNAEFNYWLLIVGLVVGAGLVWLVLADSNRRDSEIADLELPLEATWISEALLDEGRAVDPPTVEQVLRLHRTYLTAPPPDGPELDPEPMVLEPSPAPERRPHATSSEVRASEATGEPP